MYFLFSQARSIVAEQIYDSTNSPDSVEMQFGSGDENQDSYLYVRQGMAMNNLSKQKFL